MTRKDAGVRVSHKNSGLIRQGGVNLKYDSDLTSIIKPLIVKQRKRGCVSVCARERQKDRHI